MTYVSKKKNNYLIHHGIKGQKWGVRRFQNEDGSYTKAGMERYYKDPNESFQSKLNRLVNYDTYSRFMNYELSKKREQEISRLKRPDDKDWWKKTGPGVWDYEMTDKARKYSSQLEKIENKYDKEFRKNDKSAGVEIRDLRKSVFSNEKIKTKVQEASNLRKELNRIEKDTIDENSPYANKAYKKYLKENKGSDDDDLGYGFYHYTWRPGNADYDAAMSIYKKKSKELSSEYDKAIVNIGKIAFDGCKNIKQKDLEKYLRTFGGEADNYIRNL